MLIHNVTQATLKIVARREVEQFHMNMLSKQLFWPASRMQLTTVHKNKSLLAARVGLLVLGKAFLLL
jgi:hypothetical protein